VARVRRLGKMEEVGEVRRSCGCGGEFGGGCECGGEDGEGEGGHEGVVGLSACGCEFGCGCVCPCLYGVDGGVREEAKG
jgi:hypothetical protein